VDYRESLDYLYGLQQFGVKLGLENIQALLERLGHPEKHYPIIHVAGTNGKGSVCATLGEILSRAGYRPGLYTSPHLHSFTERVRVGGTDIDAADVACLTREIRDHSAGIPATFFEFTTAMALLHFRRQKVDFAVLEVGMGGRLDATNAVSPEVGIITPISLDHAAHLGENIAAIAGEKAGIIKDNMTIIIGRQYPEALQVLQGKALSRKAPSYLLGRDFITLPSAAGFSFQGMDMPLSDLHAGLCGLHQHDNAATALAAAAILRQKGFFLPEHAVREGVAKVSWPGRLEWWGGKREILLDGAHNGGGAVSLADYLAALPVKGIRWVVGMKSDKDAQEILAPVSPLITALYCTEPPVERPFPSGELVRQGSLAGIEAQAFASPTAALEAALQDRLADEIVLVAGSLFLVAAAREWLMRKKADTCPMTEKIDQDR
jgi:dihydrofolate synthase / folylpolyglutamate synthase